MHQSSLLLHLLLLFFMVSFSVASVRRIPRVGAQNRTAAPAGLVSKAALGWESLPWGFCIPKDTALEVKGKMPSWLSGSLYRNGPGLFPKVAQPHWFDGLAYLQGFHFSNGKVTYETKFVGSTAYNHSKLATKSLILDPCKVVLGNSQTNYVPMQGFSPNTAVTINKVANAVYLSNTAAMISNQFDPVTLGDLATPFTFQDNVPNNLMSPEHRHVDPHGNLFHFGYVFGADPSYMLYWIPAGTLNRKVLANAAINPLVGQPSYLHSFCLTENFIVLSDIPAPVPESFDWSKFRLVAGVPTTWRAFHRATGTEMFNWTSPQFFMFHHINCYEDHETNAIVVDLITFPDTAVMTDLFLDVLIYNPTKVMSALWHGRPYRYQLPMSQPHTGVTGSEIAPCAIELPTINYDLYNTRPYRYFYAISASSPRVDFYDQLIKVDTLSRTTKVWQQSDTYPGEPIFVAAPNSMAEDDGVILSVVLNPAVNGSFLVILNATTFTEIARANTPHYAPFGFHGMYSNS